MDDVLEKMRGLIMELPANPIVDELQDAWESLAAEVRALRKDRERLDWIAQNCELRESRATQGIDVNGPRIRAVIDAALSSRGEDAGA